MRSLNLDCFLDLIYHMCDVSWRPGQLFLAFHFWDISFVFGEGAGGGGGGKTKYMYKVKRSFQPILKEFSLVQLSSKLDTHFLSHSIKMTQGKA